MKIYFAGNMIVDSLKKVEIYPKCGMLSKILSEEYSVGGTCNITLDMKTMDPSIDVKVFGRIGNDDKGEFIKNTFLSKDIDVSDLIIDEEKSTSYTDVITEKSGARTFFQYGGANENLCVEDFDIEKIDCDLFHVGYLLLLDSLDAYDETYGTKLAKLLKKVSEKGIKTSIDVVSDTGNKYKKIVIPSLKYCSYAIINEIEISKITDIEVRSENDEIDFINAKLAIDKLFEFGVQDTVIIHCPECAIMKRKGKDFVILHSIKVESKDIASTVGAGDAFLAGALYGLTKNYDDELILKIAHTSARFNLMSNSSTSGAKSIEEIMEFIGENYVS